MQKCSSQFIPTCRGIRPTGLSFEPPPVKLPLPYLFKHLVLFTGFLPLAWSDFKLQRWISFASLALVHLVSKYGHYEGTVTWRLGGKLMADREGQKDGTDGAVTTASLMPLWKKFCVSANATLFHRLTLSFVRLPHRQLSIFKEDFFYFVLFLKATWRGPFLSWQWIPTLLSPYSQHAKEGKPKL